jgi:hypothetical protein
MQVRDGIKGWHVKDHSPFGYTKLVQELVTQILKAVQQWQVEGCQIQNGRHVPFGNNQGVQFGLGIVIRKGEELFRFGVHDGRQFPAQNGSKWSGIVLVIVV